MVALCIVRDTSFSVQHRSNCLLFDDRWCQFHPYPLIPCFLILKSQSAHTLPHCAFTQACLSSRQLNARTLNTLPIDSFCDTGSCHCISKGVFSCPGSESSGRVELGSECRELPSPTHPITPLEDLDSPSQYKTYSKTT